MAERALRMGVGAVWCSMVQCMAEGAVRITEGAVRIKREQCV